MYGSLFLLRLAVGAIFIYHAIPKLREPKSMASAIGWNFNQVLGLGIMEFIGGLSLIGGVGMQFSSLVLAVIMMGAIYHKIKKWHVPFSAPSATGWEFDLLLLCANLTIYLKY
ncbi:MAG: DoxX family protein [Candidatus Taylorbacteria bacterium]|nr:DoxX family protein [Candidatus Taylorbacteria bacterium]